jgi:hypothetical protein
MAHMQHPLHLDIELVEKLIHGATLITFGLMLFR